ncbi:hypothetical protein ARMGADRAFT_1038499 [Armillaria gallica]|uniref:Uncharacterized protein n=1 Tax=Armillaria gallica TaxID=47427 RepID=A0A2H3CHS9_ARMGA|nr:hypothetical protein ARMGADRAFT_1038499 [Armillaria gallica]
MRAAVVAVVGDNGGGGGGGGSDSSGDTDLTSSLGLTQQLCWGANIQKLSDTSLPIDMLGSHELADGAVFNSAKVVPSVKIIMNLYRENYHLPTFKILMSEPAKKKGQAGWEKGQKDRSRPLNVPPQGIGVPTQTHEDNPDDVDDEFNFDMDDFTPQDLEKVDRDISDALAKFNRQNAEAEAHKKWFETLKDASSQSQKNYVESQNEDETPRGDCAKPLEKNGTLPPWQVTDLEDSLYIVTWSQELISSLPPHVQLAFPATLSHKGGLSHSVMQTLRVGNQHKMGPNGVHSLLLENHTHQFNVLQAQYLEAILERIQSDADFMHITTVWMAHPGTGKKRLGEAEEMISCKVGAP